MIDPDGTHFHCQHWSNSCCVKAYLCTTREEETKQSGCRGFFLLQKKKKNNHRFKKKPETAFVIYLHDLPVYFYIM